MDGKGRWVDNVFVQRLWRSVKYEEVYLYAYEGLGRYFRFYNAERRHQGLVAGHPTRWMLTAAHGPRQREAGEPTGAEDTYRPVQSSGSTSTMHGGHRIVRDRSTIAAHRTAADRRGRRQIPDQLSRDALAYHRLPVPGKLAISATSRSPTPRALPPPATRSPPTPPRRRI